MKTDITSNIHPTSPQQDELTSPPASPEVSLLPNVPIDTDSHAPYLPGMPPAMTTLPERFFLQPRSRSSILQPEPQSSSRLNINLENLSYLTTGVSPPANNMPALQIFAESHPPCPAASPATTSPPKEFFPEPQSLSSVPHHEPQTQSSSRSKIKRPQGLENLKVITERTKKKIKKPPLRPTQRESGRQPVIIYSVSPTVPDIIDSPPTEALKKPTITDSPPTETLKKPTITYSPPTDFSSLMLHCSFLLDYEFSKEELVELWIAEGLVPVADHSCRIEDVAAEAFDSLVSNGFIAPSRYDKTVDYLNPKGRKQLYKVSESMNVVSHSSKFSPPPMKKMKVTESFMEQRYARVSLGNIGIVSEKVLHLSVQCENVDWNEVNISALKRLNNLHTLFLIPSFGFSLERIPSDSFLWFKHLRSLNLSRSLLSALPASIGSLKSLRYLDLSYTPIKQLPDNIDTLHELQTLKLRGCLNLCGLPKGMNKLVNLRHLDLDVISQIKSMPPGIGHLVQLQTLSAFIVGRNYGCKIGELGTMRNLTGTFCISRLENVSAFKEAKDANLIDKKFLNNLELKWTDMAMRTGNDIEEQKILEHLQPPFGLQELTVLSYCGYKLPNWIHNPSYEKLSDITLSNCRNCQLLPSLGELPSLRFLYVKEMNELKIIDYHFCRRNHVQGNPAFPKLEKLTIEVMPELVVWTGVQHLDFPLLQKLKVQQCPKLISLPFESCLRSLQHLELCYCPSIMALPDKDVTVSLDFLLIKDCLELKQCCHKGEGQDWGKIAHVPNILVDDEKITWQ